MKQIICTKKGRKLAQEPDCKCDTFRIYLNINREPVIECTKCKTRYELNKL